MNSPHKEITPEQRAELVAPADWERLSLYLSEDALWDLLALLAASDPPVRRALIAEALESAESRGDRAVFLSWARVAYANDPLRSEDAP